MDKGYYIMAYPANNEEFMSQSTIKMDKGYYLQECEIKCMKKSRNPQ